MVFFALPYPERLKAAGPGFYGLVMAEGPGKDLPPIIVADTVPAPARRRAEDNRDKAGSVPLRCQWLGVVTPTIRRA